MYLIIVIIHVNFLILRITQCLYKRNRKHEYLGLRLSCLQFTLNGSEREKDEEVEGDG